MDLFERKQEIMEMATLRNLSNDEAYKKELELWHTRMIEHLSERGEPYVKNGELNIFQENILLSPNYPHKKEK